MVLVSCVVLANPIKSTVRLWLPWRVAGLVGVALRPELWEELLDPRNDPAPARRVP